MGPTTGVTILHPVADGEAFQDWSERMVTLARSASDCLSAGVSMHDDAALEWAVAASFATEDALHAWLDSPQRQALLRDGQTRGIWCATADLVLIETDPAPAGVAAFRQSVAAGKQDEFRDAQLRLASASSAFTGYQGTALLPLGAPGEWLSLVRFRTGGQLSAWLGSRERTEALRGLRTSLTRNFTAFKSTTPFATTVRIEGGRTLMTPNWKSAMMVLLVLYPTVMILSRFFGPVLDSWGAEPWLALWLSQIISVSLMQWWLMPAASRPFRRWLDPVDGAALRVSAIGAAAIVGCYVVTLAVFATVKWLQYWDFAD